MAIYEIGRGLSQFGNNHILSYLYSSNFSFNFKKRTRRYFTPSLLYSIAVSLRTYYEIWLYPLGLGLDHSFLYFSWIFTNSWIQSKWPPFLFRVFQTLAGRRILHLHKVIDARSILNVFNLEYNL